MSSWPSVGSSLGCSASAWSGVGGTGHQCCLLPRPRPSRGSSAVSKQRRSGPGAMPLGPGWSRAQSRIGAGLPQQLPCRWVWGGPGSGPSSGEDTCCCCQAHHLGREGLTEAPAGARCRARHSHRAEVSSYLQGGCGVPVPSSCSGFWAHLAVPGGLRPLGG